MAFRIINKYKTLRHLKQNAFTFGVKHKGVFLKHLGMNEIYTSPSTEISIFT